MATTHIGAHAGAQVDEDAVYRKVMWRLMPFLFFCFFAAYLDRVNVGFAKLQMVGELQFSDYVYGLGSGIFFIGYALCEVPSNLILHRVGARIWIARIMITWAVISALFALVNSAGQFYVLRFLLGVAEAGFAPGVLLYVTFWFPAKWRARVMALFFTAVPVSGIVGAPLSGWIMHTFDGVLGHGGWRWLFVLEALPALAAGILAFKLLPNGPKDVAWLSQAEKDLIERDLKADAAARHTHHSAGQFLRDPRLWLLVAIFFMIVMGQYAISFWLPTIVQDAGIADPLLNGILTAIPFIVATIVMLALGRSADHFRERRFHLMLPMTVGAIALALSPAAHGNLALSITLLSLAAAGLLSSTAMFWAIPPAFLGGVYAAAGIATVNAIANIAGFVSPFLIGSIVTATKSLPAGLYAISAIVLVGMLLVLLLPARQVNR